MNHGLYSYSRIEGFYNFKVTCFKISTGYRVGILNNNFKVKVTLKFTVIKNQATSAPFFNSTNLLNS